MTSSAWLHFGIPSSLSWLMGNPILGFSQAMVCLKSHDNLRVFSFLRIHEVYYGYIILKTDLSCVVGLSNRMEGS